MKLKQVLAKFNAQDDQLSLTASEISAKRNAPDAIYNPVVVRVIPSAPWCDFTAHRAEFYDSLPAGYPVAEFARRVGVAPRDVQIVARKTARGWRNA